MDKLLIVDDDAGIRNQLRWGLAKSYQVLLAEDAHQALEQFRTHQPKVVSLDLGLPPDVDGASEGLRALGEILGQGRGTKVVVVSGSEDRNHALKAIELGAYDFCNKPVDLDELRAMVAEAVGRQAVRGTFLKNMPAGAGQRLGYDQVGEIARRHQQRRFSIEIFR